MQELSVQFTQGSVQSPTKKDLWWALFLKHCGKKIRDERVISRTLQRSGFLFVSNFEFLFGQRKIPYPHHHNLWFVYFLPHSWRPQMFFSELFLVKFRPYVWLIFKSGFKSIRLRTEIQSPIRLGAGWAVIFFFAFYNLQLFAKVHFLHTANFFQCNFHTFYRCPTFHCNPTSLYCLYLIPPSSMVEKCKHWFSGLL